jgi:hypothetical protein
MPLNFLNTGYFADKVGIGTNSPSAKLQITTPFASSPSDSIFLFTNGSNIPGGGSEIIFGSSISATPTSYNAKIAGVRSSLDNGSSDLWFQTTHVATATTPTTKMIIKSDGNVGIGTTSPIAKLHVEGDKTYSLGYLDKTSDLHIGNDTMSSAVGAYAGSITFGSTNESNLQAASIVAVQTDTDPNEIGLAFFTQHSSAGSTDLLESMRIKNDGNVGIGATNPGQKLEIEFANSDTSFSGGSGGDWGSEGIRIENTLNTVDTMAMLHFRNNDADIHVASIRQGTDDSDLGFFFEGTEKVRFTNSGNVGIGTDNPSSKLEIFDSSSSTDPTTLDSNFLLLTNGDATEVSETWGIGFNTNNIGTNKLGAYVHAIGNYSTNYNTSLVFGTRGVTAGTSATERMRIDSEGNIGMGYASPSDFTSVYADNLVVGPLSGNNGITVNSATSGYGALAFADGTGASDQYRGLIQYNHTANSLALFTNASTKITILSDGNVGINDTSPDFKLDVDGTFGVSDLPFNSSSVSVLVANETIGAEIITNGNFNTDLTDWTNSSSFPWTSATWTASGVRLQTSSSAQYKSFFQNIGTITSGKTYKISYSLVKTTGTIRVGIETSPVGSGLGYNKGFTSSEVVNDVFTATATDTSAVISFWAQNDSSTVDWVIDNVSLKEVISTNDQIQKREISSDVFTGGPFLPLAGGTMTGTAGVLMPDNFKLKFGDATTPDLQIYHDGSHSRIADAGTGNLTINATDFVVNNSADTKNMIIATDGGSVNLYYNASQKFRTISAGVEVTGDINIDSALLSNQDNTDVDTGTETVANVAIATYTAAFFDFVIKKGLNVRSGTVYACHDGDTTPLVQFTETSTQDLGDTSDVTLSVDISGANMRLLATTTSDNWSIKSLIRAI